MCAGRVEELEGSSAVKRIKVRRSKYLCSKCMTGPWVMTLLQMWGRRRKSARMGQLHEKWRGNPKWPISDKNRQIVIVRAPR